MEMYALIGFLRYATMIVAGVVVVIAIWRGMKAHEKMADSVERMADAADRIEKIVRRDREPRVWWASLLQPTLSPQASCRTTARGLRDMGENVVGRFFAKNTAGLPVPAVRALHASRSQGGQLRRRNNWC